MPETGRCVHSLGAVIHSMRDMVYENWGKEKLGTREDGGRKVKERVSEEETREREINKRSRAGKYLSIGICLHSLEPLPNGEILRPFISELQFHCL